MIFPKYINSFIEDNSSSYSDRIYKSEEPWSQPYFDEIKNLDTSYPLFK